MTLGQLFLIIWARKWALIGMVVLGIAAGISVSFIFSPRYRAETQIVIDFKSMDPISGAMLVPPGYLATQFDIIQSHRVALKVVQKLKLADNPFAKQEWREATGGRGNIDDWLADPPRGQPELPAPRERGGLFLCFTSHEP